MLVGWLVGWLVSWLLSAGVACCAFVFDVLCALAVPCGCVLWWTRIVVI